jgi:DNA-binding transcriptional ArsR family regulator
MNTHNTLDRLDIAWKALADPNRRGIVAVLREGPCSAGELARAVGLAPNAASFHLRYLLSADLLAVERRGRSLLYRLDRERLAAWRAEAERFAGASPAEASLRSLRHERADRADRSVEKRVKQPTEANATEPTRADTLPTELL